MKDIKDINDKLLRIKAGLREKERLEKMLENAIRHKRELEVKKAELFKQLQREEKDVKKLEEMSLSNFINTILGTKWEKLDKEKEEAIAAKLKYDAVCEELNDLIEDINKLEENIDKLKYLEYEHERLIKQKEEMVKSLNEDVAARLERITEEESSLLDRIKELEEAIYAGNELLYSLYNVQKKLSSAGNWGLWDIFGGDMIATMVKHSKLNEAKAEISRVQSLLRKFYRELEDVNEYVDINLNIGTFLTFADFFFDGIFSDLAVQSRIRDAESRVEDAIFKVEGIMLKLKAEKDSVIRRLEQLKKERLSIVEMA
ncbi:MAG: hypothetical protein LOD89_04510 [Tissierellales bacterium]